MNYVAEQPLKKYRPLMQEEFQKILTTPTASKRGLHSNELVGSTDIEKSNRLMQGIDNINNKFAVQYTSCYTKIY